MGNYISHQLFDVAGKVVLSNGTVHEFDHPLTVAELMLEHPQQLVVEYRSLSTGNKVTPLPADKKLDMKKVYLMIPMKIGRSGGALSADEARRLLQNANYVLRSRALLCTTGILPLLIRGCQTSVRIENNVVMHQKDHVLEQPEKTNKLELVPENFDDTSEFLSRQFSGKGWKPSLDTIKEKKMEKKVSHWLY